MRHCEVKILANLYDRKKKKVAYSLSSHTVIINFQVRQSTIMQTSMSDNNRFHLSFVHSSFLLRKKKKREREREKKN